jgi:hypothetical protein
MAVTSRALLGKDTQGVFSPPDIAHIAYFLGPISPLDVSRETCLGLFTPLNPIGREDPDGNH